MDKIIVLGTGSATPTKIFNTCFILNNGTDNILVDAGGGVGIFRQLEDANISIDSISNLIVSHKHADHIFGVIWIIRKISLMLKEGKYNKIFNIYCNDETANSIITIASATLRQYQLSELGNRIKINIVSDKETIKILNYEITFFDINGQSDKQYGFYTKLSNNTKLAFCGDEPLRIERLDIDFSNYDYMLHEAFCVESEASIYKPYEKDHATAKSAAMTAQKLNVKNLILWHTEDDDMENRKEKYTKEANNYFSGKVTIPNDLEIIELD